LPGERFIVFSQNHDQIGNRREGERLSQLVSFAGLKIAAAAVIFSPFLPLIFMGEEYGEPAPFQYFVSHSDPHLIEAVRKGRIEEFDSLDRSSHSPDPQSAETFLRSKLNWNLHKEGQHKVLWDFYQELFRLRRELPALAQLDMETIEVETAPGTLFLRRWSGASHIFAILHFDSNPREAVAAVPCGVWRKMIDSSDARWNSPGSTLPAHFISAGEVCLPVAPRSAALFLRDPHDGEP
jgi:maltooligosyltrehalose trehalohydrolase